MRSVDTNVRGPCIAAALAVLCGCVAFPDAGDDAGPEQRIESLVRKWFDLLAEAGPPARPLEEFLAGPLFRLSLAEALVTDPEELRAWREEIHATHSRIEYGFEPVQVRSTGTDLYRVSFELDRRAVDAAGTQHIARSEQSWLVRDAPGGPVIETIDERRLLPFPGTGPQIVCF